MRAGKQRVFLVVNTPVGRRPCRPQVSGPCALSPTSRRFKFSCALKLRLTARRAARRPRGGASLTAAERPLTVLIGPDRPHVAPPHTCRREAAEGTLCGARGWAGREGLPEEKRRVLGLLCLRLLHLSAPCCPKRTMCCGGISPWCLGGGCAGGG